MKCGKVAIVANVKLFFLLKVAGTTQLQPRGCLLTCENFGSKISRENHNLDIYEDLSSLQCWQSIQVKNTVGQNEHICRLYSATFVTPGIKNSFSNSPCIYF